MSSASPEGAVQAADRPVPARHDIERIPVTTLADGAALQLTVHVLDSGSPGPRLGLLAAIHGDETVAIDVIRTVLNELPLRTWRGSVVAIPVANPLAFSTQTRHTPLDMLNLNRVFPGDPGGSLTEQLAHAISRRLEDQVDALIDFHGTDSYAANDYIFMPPAGEGHDTTRSLVQAFGQSWLYEAGPIPGSVTAHLSALGVPAIIPEFGGGTHRFEHFHRLGVQGVYNVMAALDMIESPDLEPRLDVQWVVRDRLTLRASQGGLFVPELGPERLGAVVDKGVLMGTVIDPATFETLETLVAPYDRNAILLARTRSRIHCGDYCFIVADATTAGKLEVAP